QVDSSWSTADLALAHSHDGGVSIDWQAAVGRTYDATWSVNTCTFGGAALERLADGRRHVVYLDTLGTMRRLHSALFDGAGAALFDAIVASDARMALPWLARNASDRTAAI